LHIAVFIDGEKIKLSHVVEKIFKGSLEGAVKSLGKLKSDWKKIEIKIER